MTLGEVFSQYPAGIVTIGTAFAFLWLALYVYRVNPEDDISKLASTAMVIVFFYLLSNFLSATATTKAQIVLVQRALWWLPLAPIIWLQLSQGATEALEFKGGARAIGNALNKLRLHAALGALYGCAIVFVTAGIFTDSLFKLDVISSDSLPLKGMPIPTGPGHTMLAGFIFLSTSIACINFLGRWRKQSEREFLWISLGSILFWLASAGLLVTSITGFKAGPITGNRMLAIGIFVVAVAILKHNALLKKEALERDVVYSSIGALGIAAIYLAAIFLGQRSILDVPVLTLVLITTLALTTHILADTLKIWFIRVVGTRLGLFSSGDIRQMEQLYHEASRVKRRPAPAIELFEDGNLSVSQLLELLTPRQREIITLRAKGLSDKQIADTLEIKLPTVRKHVEDIKARIGSRDKADCAIYCVVTGLLSKDDLVDWFDSVNSNNRN